MRKIIHLDMDAFFASVEQRDRTELRGQPVIVAGPADSRGVVCTCSYEARKFGVRSAMPSATAARLCPQGIFVAPRFSAYKEASQQIHTVFRRYTSLIEPLSLDEAFLDVTHHPSATILAEKIRQEIYEATKLTGSAGVSYNKFLAKIASDQQKPNGLTVITPDEALGFLATLPVRRFFGVGKRGEEKLKRAGIETGEDLRRADPVLLQRLMGKQGASLQAMAWGKDERPVNPNRQRKSIGKETTFPIDLSDEEEMLFHLLDLARESHRILVGKELLASTVTVKVKLADFTLQTRAVTLPMPTESLKRLLEPIEELLGKSSAVNIPVRLLGVSLSGLRSKHEKPAQLLLPLYG